MDTNDILTLVGLILNCVVLLSQLLTLLHLRFVCGKSSCMSRPANKSTPMRKTYTDEEAVSLTDSSPDREEDK